MRRVLLGLVLAACLGAPLAAQTPMPAGPPASALAETDRLKAENLKLRAQVLDLQRALAQLQLNQETSRLEADRQALEAAFRVALKPDPTYVFDWTTMTFGPPTAAKASGAPPPAPQP